MKGKAKAAFWLIIFAAVAVRFYHLDLPYMEPYNSVSRQMTTATIARNFYEHGFNFFYPEIDLNGPGPYYETAEVPVVPYLIALSYKAAGGVREWAGRMVSVLFSLLFMLVMFLFVKRIYGIVAANAALCFLAFSPISVAFSRSVQPDMFMLLASASCLYFFYEYCRTRGLKHFFISLIFLMLALWTKPYTLYLLPVIFVMAWNAQGKSIFRDPKYYFYLAVAALSLFWYWNMYELSLTMNQNYRTLAYDRGVVPLSWGYLLSLGHFVTIFKIFFIHVLTPVASILFLLGFLNRKPEKESLIFYVWFFGIVLFLAAVWPIFIMNHYYLLAMLPVCAVFVGVGTKRVLDDPKTRQWALKPIVLGIMTLMTVATLYYYYRGLYFIPKEHLHVIEAGEEVRKTTAPDSLIVSSYGSTHSLLYYCHRKGWSITISHPLEKSIPQLEEMRKKGADYFVTTRQNLAVAEKGFEDYLRTHFSVHREAERYLIFRLNEAGNP
ncbi:MAG: glycosyltransferase family 39 protein [Candidatus Omnitrophica bacterium]|nr:glycosyltransferase family 39 protein [Candidatus Omnitrophota bacterium]